MFFGISLCSKVVDCSQHCVFSNIKCSKIDIYQNIFLWENGLLRNNIFRLIVRCLYIAYIKYFVTEIEKFVEIGYFHFYICNRMISHKIVITYLTKCLSLQNILRWSASKWKITDLFMRHKIFEVDLSITLRWWVSIDQTLRKDGKPLIILI